jgi:hypothetical protein
MKFAAWNIDKTLYVMSFASISSDKFKLDKNDVIFDVLKVEILFSLFVIKIIFAKLTLNQELVLFVGVTKDLVNVLNVAYWNEFRDCFAFYEITFRFF